MIWPYTGINSWASDPDKESFRPIHQLSIYTDADSNRFLGLLTLLISIFRYEYHSDIPIPIIPIIGLSLPSSGKNKKNLRTILNACLISKTIHFPVDSNKTFNNFLAILPCSWSTENDSYCWEPQPTDRLPLWGIRKRCILLWTARSNLGRHKCQNKMNINDKKQPSSQ